MKKIYAILFLISLFLTACNFEKNAPKTVKINEIKFQNIDNNKIYPGYIDRGGTINLAFRSSGIVEKLFINDGDYVQKGKLLGVLDDEEYKLQIKKAKTSLNDNIVKYERAKSYFERISKLYDAGGISYNEWEAAQTNLKSSINQVAILKDALKIEQDKENYRKIYAPDNGYIIDVTKSEKEFIGAGEIFATFQAKGKLEAKAFVPEKDVINLKKGQKAILTSEVFKNMQFEGEILNIIKTSLNKGSYEVTFGFKKDFPELLTGMSANIKILTAPIKNEILVPINSVFMENDKKYIFKFNKLNDFEGEAIKQEILTGDIVKDKIIVQRGLIAGDFIIVENFSNIKDGEILKYYE